MPLSRSDRKWATPQKFRTHSLSYAAVVCRAGIQYAAVELDCLRRWQTAHATGLYACSRAVTGFPDIR